MWFLPRGDNTKQQLLLEENPGGDLTINDMEFAFNLLRHLWHSSIILLPKYKIKRKRYG